MFKTNVNYFNFNCIFKLIVIQEFMLYGRYSVWVKLFTIFYMTTPLHICTV